MEMATGFERKNMNLLTVADVAYELKVTFSVAAGMMNILEKQGAIRKVGVAYHTSGKGRPCKLYAANDTVMLNLPKADSNYELRADGRIYKTKPNYKLVKGRVQKKKSRKIA